MCGKASVIPYTTNAQWWLISFVHKLSTEDRLEGSSTKPYGFIMSGSRELNTLFLADESTTAPQSSFDGTIALYNRTLSHDEIVNQCVEHAELSLTS